MKVLFTILLLLFIYPFCLSQQKDAASFKIEIEQVMNANSPDLQSYVSAMQNGEWLLIGGRTNGLHGFPGSSSDPESFPPQYENDLIYVYNPETDSIWSRPVYSELPISIADQLRSANAQEFQRGNNLYIVGGYGKDSVLSTAQNDSLVTFNKLAAINVSGVINAIKTNSSIAPYIRQITDPRMEVTGGALRMIGNDFYIVGGQSFTGQYSVNSTFVQNYTCQIRKFDIVDDGTNLSITNYFTYTDSLNLKRRDLNVSPIITSQAGEEGLAIYGGVFTDDELPFNNPVFITSNGYETDFNFEQKFSQYTCPIINIYDSSANKMSSVLMGGLSLYRFDSTQNKAVIDSVDFGSGPVPSIPYITDITVISKFSDGTVKDTILPETYPNGLLIGTNAELFLSNNLPSYENGVIKYDNLQGRTFVGYVYGGITANVNNPPDGGTYASNKIFKVYMTPGSLTGIYNAKVSSPGNFQLFQNFPNPFNPTTIIKYQLPMNNFVTLKVYDMLGREVKTLVSEQQTAGIYSVTFNAAGLSSGVYFYRVTAGNFIDSKKLIVIK
jgi:hypothetical protein